MTLEERVTAEVRALEGLDLERLRAEWRRRYGAPPKLRSPELLGLMLAFRIQSEALGGLPAELSRRLRRGVGLKGPRTIVSQGSRLVREWQGERHEVEAKPDGFEYRGQRYGSLSKVAFVITGTKWNGRRFFGLDREMA
ncbi:MAG TPA: DUF2924 domain-containing protein [Caulobacter sp.]|nr:DUF2924 domain-containing protein [Caulobacter sp.]